MGETPRVSLHTSSKIEEESTDRREFPRGGELSSKREERESGHVSQGGRVRETVFTTAKKQRMIMKRERGGQSSLPGKAEGGELMTRVPEIL